jgi:hypothetical protein
MMKRRNVQQAFVGEPNPNQEGLAAEHQGDDAVEFQTRGGRLILTVPAETPDDRVLEHQGYLSGELLLEDGRVLSFEIQEGAVGAQWNLKPSAEPEAESGTGLSTLEPPGGL